MLGCGRIGQNRKRLLRLTAAGSAAVAAILMSQLQESLDNAVPSQVVLVTQRPSWILGAAFPSGAYIAALTSRIKLGTAVVQLAARPPATLAMHAMTIDALAGGGRVIIGVGVSGPQIVEGWYGQPWGKPNARLRDYLTIVRKVLCLLYTSPSPRES